MRDGEVGEMVWGGMDWQGGRSVAVDRWTCTGDRVGRCSGESRGERFC